MADLNATAPVSSQQAGGQLTIALAGNPNAGKSTLFNALTGLRQHVGNWPGKTVERRAGTLRAHGREITLIDLPGAYSLSAHSPEELVARECLVTTPLDAVINVVDATNLERNLYLTVQLLEMETPVIIALNMADSLRKQDATIDVQRFSALLGGAPVVLISAAREEGLDQLVAAAVRAVVKPAPPVNPNGRVVKAQAGRA